MRRSDFEYSLPADLIAQSPLPVRSASRLLLLDGGTGQCTDHGMLELPGLLQPGDLLVFNDTKVLPARVRAMRASGGRVELLLERPLPSRAALVQMRASNPLRAGEHGLLFLSIKLPDGRVLGDKWTEDIESKGVVGK